MRKRKVNRVIEKEKTDFFKIRQSFQLKRMKKPEFSLE